MHTSLPSAFHIFRPHRRVFSFRSRMPVRMQPRTWADEHLPPYPVPASSLLAAWWRSCRQSSQSPSRHHMPHCLVTSPMQTFGAPSGMQRQTGSSGNMALRKEDQNTPILSFPSFPLALTVAPLHRPYVLLLTHQWLGPSPCPIGPLTAAGPTPVVAAFGPGRRAHRSPSQRLLLPNPFASPTPAATFSRALPPLLLRVSPPASPAGTLPALLLASAARGSYLYSALSFDHYSFLLHKLTTPPIPAHDRQPAGIDVPLLIRQARPHLPT
jgi:hypothetical protein